MKIMRSTVPIADTLKRALSTKQGRASLLDFINARAAGKRDARLKLVDGNKVMVFTAGPVDSRLKKGAF